MTYFYKIIKNLLTTLSTTTLENTFPSKSFSNTLFSHCINDWNKLNENLINVNSIYKFKHYLTKFIKVKENSTFSTSDPLGLKLLIRLRLNFSPDTIYDKPDDESFKDLLEKFQYNAALVITGTIRGASRGRI